VAFKPSQQLADDLKKHIKQRMALSVAQPDAAYKNVHLPAYSCLICPAPRQPETTIKTRRILPAATLSVANP